MKLIRILLKYNKFIGSTLNKNFVFIEFRVLHNSMDSTSQGEGPRPNNRLGAAFFYVAFFIVFPFFFVNIFVALIIITFQEQGEAELMDENITKNQVSLNIYLKILLKITIRYKF